ncbi:MAG: hypothetical protein ACRBBN_04275 [Methyloligellaceae bacterium]
MNISTAIQKLITWFTGVIIALLPVPLAISENLTNMKSLLIPEAWLNYYSELTFFSLSLSVLALFDSMELIANCNKYEKTLKTLFHFGFSLILLHLIIGAIHFGNHTNSETRNYPLLYTLPVTILLTGLTRFIHNIREAS